MPAAEAGAARVMLARGNLFLNAIKAGVAITTSPRNWNTKTRILRISRSSMGPGRLRSPRQKKSAPRSGSRARARASFLAVKRRIDKPANFLLASPHEKTAEAADPQAAVADRRAERISIRPASAKGKNLRRFDLPGGRDRRRHPALSRPSIAERSAPPGPHRRAHPVRRSSLPPLSVSRNRRRAHHL